MRERPRPLRKSSKEKIPVAEGVGAFDMKLVPKTLQSHFEASYPLDLAEKALLAAGFTVDEVRHRRVLLGSKSSLVKGLMDPTDEAFLKHVKETFDRAERFKEIRERFQSPETMRGWIENSPVFAGVTDKRPYYAAVRLVWNGARKLGPTAKHIRHQAIRQLPPRYNPWDGTVL